MGKYESEKSVFLHISRSVLLNVFSLNLAIRENLSFVSVLKLLVREYMNYLTARKLKARK